jgi:hypothetical protein
MMKRKENHAIRMLAAIRAVDNVAMEIAFLFWPLQVDGP